MKSMALNNRIVISVIHQPRSSIYEMFDKLLLLSCGRTIYLGPANTAKEYFKASGFICPSLFNPSDFFLDVLSPDTRSTEKFSF
jgi:ABC-type multidrug transport system ATPase subunit